MGLLSRLIASLRGRREGAPQRLPSPDELVRVATPFGEAEAQIFSDMLADAGIRSLTKNTDPLSARGGGTGPPWGYELWVLRRDLRRAREVLDVDADPRG